MKTSISDLNYLIGVKVNLRDDSDMDKMETVTVVVTEQEIKFQKT